MMKLTRSTARNITVVSAVLQIVEMLRQVLMCRPTHFDVVAKLNAWVTEGVQINRPLAISQWEKLKGKLEELGVEVKQMEAVKGLSDLVFCGDGGLVHNRKVFLSNFAPLDRREERRHYADWFTSNGYKVLGDPTAGFYEGSGDSAIVGDRLFCGFGFRSERKVYEAVQKLGDFRLVYCQLVNEKFYGLDMAFKPLNEHLALWYPKAFTKESQLAMQNEMELIDVGDADANRFVCNSIVVGQTVLLPTGCEDVKEILRSRGFTTDEFHLIEFLKAGGSGSCMLLRLS